MKQPKTCPRCGGTQDKPRKVRPYIFGPAETCSRAFHRGLEEER